MKENPLEMITKIGERSSKISPKWEKIAFKIFQRRRGVPSPNPPPVAPPLILFGGKKH